MFKVGKHTISNDSKSFVIAEIGHNHQGNLQTAIQLVRSAAYAGADAVKFQKRENQTLYTKKLYNAPYDNENSYGSTYGEHREFLEFGWEEFVELKRLSDELGVEFLATPFDFQSVDFLEKLGVGSYKIASGDLTNIPLLEYVAKLGKPMFVSTGAASLEEIRIAYASIKKHHNELCLLHCTSGYPTEYKDLNLNVITVLKNEFPDIVIGYSGHDNGILASSIAYMLGARVIEKHFTLNRSWTGTDHKFSLEPEGLRKQVRDLNRIGLALGDGIKILQEFEKGPRMKMGKGVYSSKPLKAGSIIKESDVCLKSPANGVPPYSLKHIIGKKLNIDLVEEEIMKPEFFDE